MGGEVDAKLPVSSFETLPTTHLARRLSKQRARHQHISCFARGILTIFGWRSIADGALACVLVAQFAS